MFEVDLNAALNVAISAAQAGGQILRDNYGRVKEINYKGATDLVTEVDKASEAAILDILKTHYPFWNILAEESGMQGNEQSNYKWLVDPLDGTTNYAHSYPFFCVSIALEVDAEILLGVVYDPMKDEMFSAQRGLGTKLNGRKLNVSATSELDKCLLVTGFPYNVRQNPGRSFEYFEKFVLTAQAVRRDGSAALDLAYVAAGRSDGFWEEKLCPWDVAAGSLLVMEAGGRVTGFTEGFSVYSDTILATNGFIHKAMQEVLTPG